MPLPDPPLQSVFVDLQTGYVTRPWQEWLLSVVQNSVNVGQTAISNASTTHAITDPSDAPASADALRDDLVSNTVPSVETSLNTLGTKINSILTALRNSEILNS